MIETYAAGTISIASNTAAVTGLGTRWLTYITAGDTITINGETIEILSVDDFNKLTLNANYTGINADTINYYITITANLTRAKTDKTAEIMQAYRVAIDSITQPYEQSEIDTWWLQETQARAYTADNLASVPFLTAQATARGMTVAELTTIIITKANAYESTVATALGKRQKLITDIAAAADITAVDLINW